MILLTEDVNKIVNKPKESNFGMVIRRRDRDYIRKVIRISQKYMFIPVKPDTYSGF